jgi:arsenate reductase (thioredoxin)
MQKVRVLFLCTGNSARSQMAEAFLRAFGGPGYEAHSAGLKPQGIHPLTHRVMAEAGISLEGQYSKNVSEYLGKLHFSHLITVCDSAQKQCPTVFPGTGYRLHWSFEDPAGIPGTEEEKLTGFRQVRDQISRRIREWLEEQAQGAPEASPLQERNDP